MQTVGYIDRVNLGGAGGSIVWATFAGVGKAKPDVYRQTTPHEIAVSTACARYAAAATSGSATSEPSTRIGHRRRRCSRVRGADHGYTTACSARGRWTGPSSRSVSRG
jgi:hypothetical protein